MGFFGGVRRCCALALLALSGLGPMGQAWAQTVLFINPGRSDELYWHNVSQAMHGAARSLGMALEVRYADRNHVQPIAIAREVAARPKALRPQFVVFTNDYSAGPEILRILDAAGIDHFMAFSGIQPALKSQTGAPRQKFKHWLGSLEPRAQDAGYLTAKALIAAARASPWARSNPGPMQLLAIAGDRSTPSSMARNAGMRQAVAEAGDVVLVQEVFGEWRRDRAREQMRVLLRRHPQLRLVWAGNDEMALGAMEAWRAHGGTPGVDGFFSAINSSAEALEARRQGALSALAAGHFLAGAWSLVMLYDYAHGLDFASEGLEQQRPMFVLLEGPALARWSQHAAQPLAQQWDFRSHSKRLNPRRTVYGYEFEPLLR